MPDLLLLFKYLNKISCLCRIGLGCYEYLEFCYKASVGKKQLISNINNVTSYTVPHNSINVLHKGLSGSSVLEEVCFISQEAKGHAY